MVEHHSELVAKVSDYLRPEGSFDVAFILSLVLDVSVTEQGGLSKLIEYHERLRFSSGGKWCAEEIFNYYTEILAYG